MISSVTPGTAGIEGQRVSLVIPGRNCADTIKECLQRVTPLLEQGQLIEILFVDDRSTDGSAEIASTFPVRIIRGAGIGAAAARNLGIDAAKGEFVWCLDADCLAMPDNLQILMSEFESIDVAAVGGSLGNAVPNNLLANLIQWEIAWRHSRMPRRVNFLASGNVVYRRDVLIDVGGFDERFRWAHDAELAFRLRSAGHELRFRPDALVLHHHFTSWNQYLSKQAAYAKNRMLLYKRYPDMAKGDDYSSVIDHLQPPLALLILITLPLLGRPQVRILPVALLAGLILLCLQTTIAVVRHSQDVRASMFLPFAFLRAFARAVGAVSGILMTVLNRRSSKSPRVSLHEQVTR